MLDPKILRVIDVNFNRTKEGLRVCEDIFRFIYENDYFRKKVRSLRHNFNKITLTPKLKAAIFFRDSLGDLGQKVDLLETKRANTSSILYSNLSRVKESLRVLEEFFKLVDLSCVKQIKNIRYQIYSLEKSIYKKWPPVK